MRSGKRANHSTINGVSFTLKEFAESLTSLHEMKEIQNLLIHNSNQTLSSDSYKQEEIWFLRSIAKIIENSFHYFHERELNAANIVYIGNAVSDLREFFKDGRNHSYCNAVSKEYVFSEIINGNYHFHNLHLLTDKFFPIFYNHHYSSTNSGSLHLIIEYQGLLERDTKKMFFYMDYKKDERRGYIELERIKPFLSTYHRKYVDDVVLFILRKFVRENSFLEMLKDIPKIEGKDAKLGMRKFPLLKEFAKADDETYRQMLEDEDKMSALARELGFFVF